MNEAIELCEVTGVPLCAGCLWYTEDGRRVSERAAKNLESEGVVVFPPSLYLDQLGTAAQLPRLPEPPHLTTQHRNGNDLIALFAGISGALSIATCFGVGIALCVPPLPLLPLLLGGIGLVGARGASNPDRARTLSWVGIVGGAGFVALVLLLIIGSLAFGTTTMLTSVFIPRTFATPVITPGP
ncbi:MAG TPA: hypothetical protein VGK87_02615 [Anaerolineae bacterium]